LVYICWAGATTHNIREADFKTCRQSVRHVSHAGLEVGLLSRDGQDSILRVFEYIRYRRTQGSVKLQPKVVQTVQQHVPYEFIWNGKACDYI